MKFFLFIKERSDRIPNKTFRRLGDTELYRHTLYKLQGFDVFVDTDSAKVLEACKSDPALRHVTCYARSREHRDASKNPILGLLERFLNEFVTDRSEPIVQTVITAPFVRVDTMLKAVECLDRGFDSVASTTVERTFSYLDSESGPVPINFDPTVIQRTQDLPAVRHLNNAFYILTKEMFLRHRYKIGKSPCFFELPFPENLDIDEPEDFVLAEKVWRCRAEFL